jgi:putative aminopeptidase FrvX
VSGRENNVREIIRREVEPYADAITVDAMGN